MASNKLQGWLKKESHDYFKSLRKWQWRFFILDFESKTLRYYTNETLSDMRGEYVLDGSVLSEVGIVICIYVCMYICIDIGVCTL
jgi:hypothetical protein